ncbi:TetR/AcrR family transcriptional regulator [Cohnella thailandensis]|uniref:TetR/AcrR family transcriptional regulator n=1 Tax=Cohnella thailandensis TaxID=557557 RepID=A0A841T4Z7_9BACL|nr:TetR/AcrR family transcriptional regulator [Cohnella thailandensis]MBB6637398.1 TetR/AcrR family transcriptional regulator [Cohnella thailandensis]MBP1976727.1 AcrR family transcriptional regulator [Cohnella thailandensis]
MNDKRKQIIEAAMRCFSRKGVQATSIQDIVDELGMAKGSLYFYFKSKDELVVSVFSHFADLALSGLAEQPQEKLLPPKERLRLQLQRSIELIVRNRNIPLMLAREPLELKSGMKSIMEDVRSRLYRWYRDYIEEIYGPESRPYAWDGAALLSGMMLEYYRVLLIGEPSFHAENLSRFFVNRLDDLMKGMIREQGVPLMGSQDLMGDSACGEGEEDSRPDNAYVLLRELRRQTEAEGRGDLPRDRYEDMRAALSVLEDELGKPVPNRILVRGMLAFLKETPGPSRLNLVEQLESRILPQ